MRLPPIALGLLLWSLCGATPACESGDRGDTAGAVWSVRVADDTWTPPPGCAEVFERIAQSVGRTRGQSVRIETLPGGNRPSSLSIARLAAVAFRIRDLLVGHGVDASRIRVHERRTPDRRLAAPIGESHVIVRLVER